MAYRLGVDVGGTFTDLFLVNDENGGGAVPRQDAVDARRPVAGRAHRRAADLRGGRDRRRRAAQHPARHDRRDERRARVQGRARRADHDAGLRADPAPRALADAGAAGGLDHHDQARPAGLARGHARGRRADGRARRDASSRSTRRRSRAIVRDLVESGVESLTVGLINSYVNGRARGADRRDRRAALPGLPGHALVARAARVPRVRAHADGVHELVRAAEGRRATSSHLQSELPGDRREGRRQHPPLRRRPDDDDARRRATRSTASSPGPSGGVAGALYVAAQGRASTDILTFDMGGTSTDVALCQDGEPTIGRETSIGHFRIKVPVRRRAHGRRRRRLDRPRAGADEGAPRRPAVGRAPSPGPAAYGKGGDGADRDRRERRARPPAAAACSAARWRSTSRRRARRCRRIADAMGLDSVEEAAEGILAIVNENMAGALRLVSVQRGHDPREFALVAYGGAGPLHANAVAEADGLVPGDRAAGAGPALRDRRPRGRLPRRVRPDVHPPRSPRPSRTEVARRSSTSSAAARDAWLDGEGIAEDGAARHVRRRHALPPAGLRDPGRARRRTRSARAALGGLEERFNALHEQLYGFRMPGTARGDRQPAGRRLRRACRSPSCRTGAPGGADASGAVVGRARRSSSTGEQRADEDLRPRAGSSPAMRDRTARRS